MKASAYQNLAENQQHHWWYRGRRAVIQKTLKKYLPHRDKHIVEIGSGAGGNLTMLKAFGKVSAFEMDDFAREHATRHNSDVDINKGHLPDGLTVRPGSVDVVCLFDVLEHVQDDRSALIKIHELLADNGRLILTVPAYQWLYGHHDEQLEHFRRYSMRHLKRLLQSTGFRVTYSSYFNFLLFPVALVVRLMNNLNPNLMPVGTGKPHNRLNESLYFIFKQESKILPKWRLPFGLSIIMVVTKSADC